MQLDMRIPVTTPLHQISAAPEADPDFDRAPERAEQDLSGTAELPPPPDAAEDPAQETT